MKYDSINRLHWKPTQFALVPERFRYKCIPELANIAHFHSYCAYVWNRKYPGNNPRNRAEDFPEIPSYFEYVAMKKERLRRWKISDTLSYRHDLKSIGLSIEQIELFVRRRKAKRLD